MQPEVSAAWHRALMRTPNQLRGDAAERLVADRLTLEGWRILGHQVRVERAEIDLLAVDPGPPSAIVAIEVRWRTRRDFGLAEETVDRHKVRRLRRALWIVCERGQLPDGTTVPRTAARVDVVAVEPGPIPGDVALRHHRAVG